MALLKDILVGFMVVIVLALVGCSRAPSPSFQSGFEPDTTIVSPSKYPIAVDPSQVGKYAAVTKSGAGYFYDDVLEYRVWVHRPTNGDYYLAFASYEPALEFSKKSPGAEEPLVLVRQLEWINETKPGRFEKKSGERISEWQVGWLANQKRTGDSISKFLSEKAGTK